MRFAPNRMQPFVRQPFSPPMVRRWFDVFWSRIDVLRESHGGRLFATLPGYLSRLDRVAATLKTADPLVQALQPRDRAAAVAADGALAPITEEVQSLYTDANSATDLADVRQVAAARWTYITLLCCRLALMAISLLLIALQFRDIRAQDCLLAERARRSSARSRPMCRSAIRWCGATTASG